MHFNARRLFILSVPILAVALTGGRLGPEQQPQQPDVAASTWQLGTPITTYWAGPAITDVVAAQMEEGGWNLVWCTEKTLDVAQRHGLRADLADPLLTPDSLDHAQSRDQLDAFIRRVKDHPALYSYHLKGELSVSRLPDWARLARYIRERDSRHALQFALYPTYATNRQLGVDGDEVSAYREYLRQFIRIIKPDILSFDHYNFLKQKDRDGYFRNLGLVREAAVGAHLPFMNIVQASAWKGRFRIPSGNELRWLVYTSLAYGAQGVSYFVYRPPEGYSGGMTSVDGNPTPLYFVASALNRQFVAVASQLQGLQSIGAFHAGTIPPGAAGLPADVAIRPEPEVNSVPFESGRPVQGFVLGYFGASSAMGAAEASHVLVVNLDYSKQQSIRLVARRPLSVFDADARSWRHLGENHVELRLPAGSGQLLRLDP